MRCQICDKNLSDFESTRKHAITGQYLDTCNECLEAIEIIPTLDREDLRDVVSDDIDITRLESDCY